MADHAHAITATPQLVNCSLQLVVPLMPSPALSHFLLSAQLIQLTYGHTFKTT